MGKYYRPISIIQSKMPESSLRNKAKCFYYNHAFSRGKWRLSYKDKAYILDICGIKAKYCTNPFSDLTSLVGYLEYWERGKSGLVIDAGGFEGIFSVCAGILTGSAGKVLVLEPFPESSIKIEENIALNKLHNVKVFGYAVWHREERLILDVSNPHAAALASSSGDRRIEVVGKKLDDILKETNLDGPVSLIKMDIEGAEIQALHGCEEIIARWKPQFIVASYHIVDGEPTTKRVEEFLLKRDYEVKTVFKEHPLTVGYPNNR